MFKPVINATQAAPLDHLHNRGCAIMVMFAVLIQCCSCSTAPAKLDGLAASIGCVREVVKGKDFDHIIYYRLGQETSPCLHVYIEGDGSPWIAGKRPASDPTPRNPLVLRLLALDPSPSLYLGRPCYNGLANTASCKPYFWTHGRYSQAVIISMELVLRNFLRWHPYAHLVFIGHSGGGTLAMLLAARFPATRMVVTLAGNLDTDAWCDFHGYSPLIGSLNPAEQPPLPKSIRQIHLVGKNDANIPPRLIKPVVSLQPNADFRVIEGCGHADCWETMWPQLMRDISF